jgi:hypothetical protein
LGAEITAPLPPWSDVLTRRGPSYAPDGFLHALETLASS